tara:strand:- start:841 stop:1188 length:348 start_codon:yes stop_codon:yes gene_type:complete
MWMKILPFILIVVFLLWIQLSKSNIDYKKAIEEGAIIIDVRSPEEFNQGHIDQSINIPLQILNKNLNTLKDKEQTIITCCASGMRSARAKSILKKNGYISVHNGGGWVGLKSKIK